MDEHTSFHEDTEQTSKVNFTSLEQNDMASISLTQKPESQPIYASKPFNNSSYHGDTLNSKSVVAVEYNSEHSIFSLLDSDEDLEH